MPFLKIEVTSNVSEETKQDVVQKLRRILHEVKGDPESMVSVFVEGSITGVFGVGNFPAANVHLQSFDLTPPVTAKLSRRIAEVLHQDLGVSPDRSYVFFENIPEPHLTGWSGKTFAELLTPHRSSRFDLTRSLRGRFLNSSNQKGSRAPTPLPNLVVELWVKSSFQLNGAGYRLLSRTNTDDEGFFDIFFDVVPTEDAPNILELRLLEPDQLVMVNGRPATRRFIAYLHPLRDDGRFQDMPVGQILVPFYGYDPQWPFPYAAPDSIRNGFGDAQESRFKESEMLATVIGQLVFGELDSTPGGIDVDTLQSRFPEAPTIRMEREVPGSTRSDEFFADRILNNMAPPLFRIDPQDKSLLADPNIYVLDCNWHDFERRSDLTLLSFRARFASDGERLIPHDILIGENNIDLPWQFTRFLPTDGEKWLQAKRLVRAHYNNLVGQVHFHLAQTHFNLEQYGISFLRHVHRHPVRRLLYPFIREILAINEKGRTTLLGGPSIVYEIEPISRNSVTDWVVNALGNLDWKGFSPRTPICTSHGFAHCAQLYWETVSLVVDEFFDANSAVMDIGWEEISAFSSALVGHSVPFASAPKESSADAGQWYCLSEISERGREGSPAVSPITASPTPDPQSISNLKQVCRYVIYFSTFVHSWTHDKMLLDLGELRYSGIVRNGGLGPESDDQIIAPIRQATFALGSTHTLGSMNCGTMLRNEDGDVPSHLITLLKEQRDAFQQNGFDIQRLCARLNT